MEYLKYILKLLNLFTIEIKYNLFRTLIGVILNNVTVRGCSASNNKTTLFFNNLPILAYCSALNNKTTLFFNHLPVLAYCSALNNKTTLFFNNLPYTCIL